MSVFLELRMVLIAPGDDRLSSSSATLANQPEFELMVKAAKDMIVGELSLSHLLSSKTLGSQSVISSVQSTNDHRRSIAEG